jgi:ketosteroid isomerase-like protein
MPITRRSLVAASPLALAVISLPSHAESADDAAVRKAIGDLIKAITSADKAALEAVVTDQLSFGHSSGRIENKAEFVGGIAGKKVIYKSVTPGEPAITVVGSTAIARYPVAVEVEVGGKPLAFKLGIITVWVKDGGAWKLLAHQSFNS